MNPPKLDPVSSFEVNITWEAPDPVKEARGKVVMYQVILTRNSTNHNPFAPPTEDVVRKSQFLSLPSDMFNFICFHYFQVTGHGAAK